jgi:LacI family transcriptional regulator
MHIKIPKEVGVIGYSNDPFTDIIQPTLTSIEQYPQDIGVNAAELMLNLIEHSTSPRKANKNIHIQPKLIIRESTNR